MPDDKAKPKVIRKAFGGLSSLFNKRRNIPVVPSGLCDSSDVVSIQSSTPSPVVFSSANFSKGPATSITELPKTPSLSWSSSSGSDVRSSTITVPSTTQSDNYDEEALFEFDREASHHYEETQASEDEADDGPDEETLPPDSYQDSRLKMMHAFKTALAQNTGSRLGQAAVLATQSKPTRTISPERRARLELQFEGPGVTRTRAASMSDNYTNITRARTDISEYSDRALPPLPAWNGYFSYNGQHNRAKISKRTLLQQRRPREMKRRGSCPSEYLCSKKKASAEGATIEDSIASSADPIVGAALILYWLGNNRRFLDPQCHAKLMQPGARCLGIELGAYGFENIYPNAKLEVYRSDITSGKKTTGRYLKLPYPDASFDVVTSRAAASIVPLAEWPATLKELKRLLKPGGMLEIISMDQWINIGPKTAQFQSRVDAALTQQGFAADLSLSLLPLIEQCNFQKVDVAQLAMPINWGGRYAQVWRRYCEPLRIAREQSMVKWAAEETPKARWHAIEGELITSRSARGLCVVSATV